MPRKAGSTISTSKTPKSVLDLVKAKRDEVISITDEFCSQYLNEEYAELARDLTQKISRMRPSPLQSGQARTWAAGVVYALGRVNFLFDKTQNPYLSAADLCRLMGVSQGSATSKSREIMDRLRIGSLEPQWTLPSRYGRNPLIWMVELTNGMIIDLRHAPRDLQEQAFEAGMIPYIPADRE